VGHRRPSAGGVRRGGNGAAGGVGKPRKAFQHSNCMGVAFVADTEIVFMADNLNNQMVFKKI
jgi:hypothetical protein